MGLERLDAVRLGRWPPAFLIWRISEKYFISEVPELPGCMAHGNSYEKALENAKEVIHLWIYTAKEFGDPVPAPKG